MFYRCNSSSLWLTHTFQFKVLLVNLKHYLMCRQLDLIDTYNVGAHHMCVCVYQCDAKRTFAQSLLLWKGGFYALEFSTTKYRIHFIPCNYEWWFSHRLRNFRVNRTRMANLILWAFNFMPDFISCTFQHWNFTFHMKFGIAFLLYSIGIMDR